MASLSRYSMDTFMQSSVAAWTDPKWANYDFNGESLPDWLIRDKVKGGSRVRARFSPCPPDLAKAIPAGALGRVRESYDCIENILNRWRMFHVLPAIIVTLEDAGFGDHPWVEDLRVAHYFATMWVVDDPEIKWQRASGGKYYFEYNGVVIFDLIQ